MYNIIYMPLDAYKNYFHVYLRPFCFWCTKTGNQQPRSHVYLHSYDGLFRVSEPSDSKAADSHILPLRYAVEISWVAFYSCGRKVKRQGWKWRTNCGDMKSVSASHLQYNRWNSLLPKGLAKLWIFNFNISMNIMNCFSKTKFSLLFHPIFLSFACFGMFHFSNSKFLNETGTSNKTSNFPNIFFRFRFFCFALGVPGGLCFCVSHEGCEPRSSNAAILGMPGSIQTTSKQHPHPTSKPQKKHPPLWSQTTSVSRVKATCSAFTLEILVFLS